MWVPTEFEIALDGPTRSLLDAISVLAEDKINLDTVSITEAGHGYLVRFLTGSDEKVRTSLIKADLPFKENKVLVAQTANKPGEWLRVARAFADNGIDIKASYVLGQSGDAMRIVFVVSDHERARQICSTVAECSID